jgi:hypothetical protein
MPENYILLERTELNASAASVTFANIPQSGYTDLKIVYSARSSSTSGYAETVNMKFNNSSTSDYTWRGVYSVTATPGSNNSGGSVAQIRAGNVPSANLTANTFSNNEIYIPNYTSANFKSVSIDAVSEVNGSTDFTYTLMLQAGLRSNTAAITSIDLSLDTGGTSFVAGSTFSLYGIAAVGTTPAIAPKASGGNIIDYDGTYWIHTFTSSGTFTPQVGLTCDYLVVAGGGGGGNDLGGGGGAGGFRTSIGGSALSVASNTSYPITVGAGGVGASATPATSASDGSNSVFSTITSTGGGGGGSNNTVGRAGGSGGGGSRNFAGGAGNTPSTSPSQGNNGGTTSQSPNYISAGGGGAGAVGGNGSTGIGGDGGNGTASSITGTSVTYAGGGGGATFAGTRSGNGGTGGGGNGGADSCAPNDRAPSAGTANLGGGGGGGRNISALPGANGGSGIVIIRYPAA